MKSNKIIFGLALMTIISSCGKPNISSSDNVEESSRNSSSVSSGMDSQTSNESSSSSDSSASSQPNKAKYKITFNSNGGSSVETISAEAGESIKAPEEPLRVGYKFMAWYKDYFTFEELFVFDKMPEENIVLYARWVELGSEEIDEYQRNLKAISKKDHLYIHYHRFANTPKDYEEWDIWVWPKNGTGRIFDFKRDENNKILVDDYGGTMVELDLRHTYTDGGHTKTGERGKETVSFLNKEGEIISDIGFLITNKSSRTLGSHWKSDGGDKYLKTNEALDKSLNDSFHLFSIQDNVKDFSYKFAFSEFSNPYMDDDGTNVSAKYENVDYSKTAQISENSKELANLGVGYQIMVSSFADSDNDGMGDILGIKNKLPYLKSLNVEALWLTPIQLSDSYHGYDIIDYRKVDPKYGSKNSIHSIDGVVSEKSAIMDYVDLLNEANKLGIKIVMDLVINHTSINNVLFQQSIALEEESRAYYHWKNNKNDNLNKFWHPYSMYDYSYYGKFASSMPELNYDYQATRDVMLRIMDYWSTIGVTGYRIDAVKHIFLEEESKNNKNDIIISDNNQENYSSNLTKNLHFFRELNYNLKKLHPGSFLLGENFDGHAYQVAPYYEGLDSMLNFYMYFNVWDSIRSKATSAALVFGADGSSSSFNSGENGLKHGNKWNYPGTYYTYNQYRSDEGRVAATAVDSLFTSNHDVPRAINKTFNQTANQNAYQSVNSTNKYEAELASFAGISTMLLHPGLTWIYYGDEIGLASNLPSGATINDPQIDRLYRQPMVWDKGNKNISEGTNYTFTGDKTYRIELDSYNKSIDGVLGQAKNNDSLLEKIKKITILKNMDVFKKGDFHPIEMSKYSNNGNVYAFTRSLNGQTYSVYINLGDQTINLNEVSGEIVYSSKLTSLSSLSTYGVLVVKNKQIKTTFKRSFYSTMIISNNDLI